MYKNEGNLLKILFLLLKEKNQFNSITEFSHVVGFKRPDNPLFYQLLFIFKKTKILSVKNFNNEEINDLNLRKVRNYKIILNKKNIEKEIERLNIFSICEQYIHYKNKGFAIT